MLWEELDNNQTYAAAGGTATRTFSAGVARSLVISMAQAVALAPASINLEIRSGGKMVFTGTFADALAVSMHDRGLGIATLDMDIRLPVGFWDCRNAPMTIQITNNDAANNIAVYMAVGYEDTVRGRALQYTFTTMAANGSTVVPKALGIIANFANMDRTADDVTLTAFGRTETFPLWVGAALFNQVRQIQQDAWSDIYRSEVPSTVNVVYHGAGTPRMIYIQEA
jgi:hypothetical protein